MSTKLSEVHVQISDMRKRQNQTDKKIENIWKSIDTINENFVLASDFNKGRRLKGLLFFLKLC